ncbi:hypothetical protein MRB53_041813 [Persea americana]|nr:hypothetical protein MRB53_041813 [Persea americana]
MQARRIYNGWHRLEAENDREQNKGKIILMTRPRHLLTRHDVVRRISADRATTAQLSCGSEVELSSLLQDIFPCLQEIKHYVSRSTDMSNHGHSVPFPQASRAMYSMINARPLDRCCGHANPLDAQYSSFDLFSSRCYDGSVNDALKWQYGMNGQWFMHVESDCKAKSCIEGHASSPPCYTSLWRGAVLR